MFDTIKIMNLADCRQHVSTVSSWLWLEWARSNGYTPEDVIYRTEHCLSKDAVPMTLIALAGNEPAGTVSLWINDMAYRQDLTPWLAVLYTKPEYRGKGIGSALVDAAVNEAFRLGYEKLYLETELNDYYERFGWQFVEWAPEGNGKMLKIYIYDLKNIMKESAVSP